MLGDLLGSDLSIDDDVTIVKQVLGDALFTELLSGKIPSDISLDRSCDGSDCDFSFDASGEGFDVSSDGSCDASGCDYSFDRSDDDDDDGDDDDDDDDGGGGDNDGDDD